MMEAAAEYMYTLVCGGIFCSVILSVAGNGAGAQTRKMICGIFLIFLAISPLKDIELEDISSEIAQFSDDAESVAAMGENQATEAILNIITETCASYILTEAAQMSADVAVQVTADRETLVPVSVTITGTVTPYAKQVLISYITQNFGIEKEAQHWISP